jgi:tetratricopeptide (TPR) repeat protein
MDYILRRNIYEDIEFISKVSPCGLCRSNLALLAAVCSVIGFGSLVDKSTKQELLERSGRSEHDLISAVRSLGENYKVTGRVAKNVIDGLGIGVLVSADRIEEYQISQRMPEAEKSLRYEIQTRSETFGPGHNSLAKLKSELSLLLNARNCLHDAGRHQSDAVEILTRHHGDDHPSPLVAKIALADILVGQGAFSRAEELQRAVQPVLQNILGTYHPERITSLLILASTLANMGKLTDAEVLAKEAVSLRNEILSPNHPLTIRAETNLATILRGQGRIREASELMSKIDQKLVQSLVDDDFMTASLHVAQGMFYKELGSLDQAMGAVATAMKKIDRLKLPEDDGLRLTAMEASASIHEAYRSFQMAESILRQVLDAKTSLDVRIPWVTDSKLHLAQNLVRQSKLDDAITMTKGVMEVTGASVHENPETWLVCADIMATAYSIRGERDLAISIRRQLLESCEKEFGMQHHLSLRAAYLFGESCTEVGDFAEARKLYEIVMPHLRAEERPNKDAVLVSRLAAAACRQQGHFDQAKIYCQQSIEWAKMVYGDEHVETLASYNTLAKLYIQMEKYTAAGEIYTQKLEVQSRGTELEIYVKENIAELRAFAGDHEGAAQLRAETYELMRTVRGERHPETIQMAGNILTDNMRISLNEDVEKQALELIKLKKEIFGVQHPSTTKAMSDLAYAYGEKGKLAQAESLFREIDEIYETGGALQNPDWYATFLGKWADLYHRSGRLERAEHLERKALKIRREIYADDHRAVLVTMSNLASTLCAQGNYSDAEDLLRHVVAMREAKDISNPTSLFGLLNAKTSLAAVLFHQERLDESVGLYDAVLSVAEQSGLDESVTNSWKLQRHAAFEALKEKEKENEK